MPVKTQPDIADPGARRIGGEHRAFLVVELVHPVGLDVERRIDLRDTRAGRARDIRVVTRASCPSLHRG
jgi:hypothetical protein